MRDRQLAAAPGRHPRQSQVCAPGDAVLSAELGLGCVLAVAAISRAAVVCCRARGLQSACLAVDFASCTDCSDARGLCETCPEI